MTSVTESTVGRGELWDKFGHFGYLAVGNTGAAVLQETDELNPVTVRNLLCSVAMLVK